MTNKLIIPILIVIAVLALTLPFYFDTYLLHIVTTILIYMALSLSWDMMLRTGQLSFGTAGFFGLGAYASVILTVDFGVHPLISLLLGGIFSALIAFFLGFAVLKLREIYFAIVTLALTHVFSVVIRNIPSLTGGPSGRLLASSIFGGDPAKTYWLVLVVAIVVILLSELFRRSRIHFAISSIRNDEITARSSGIDVFKYLLFVFVLTSAIQGVIGAVYAQQYAFVNPETTFSLDFLLLPIAIALVGGIYSTIGPIIGAFLLGFVSEYLKLVMPYGHLIVYGIIIVIIVLFLPQGLYKPIAGKIATLRENNIGSDKNAQSGS
ncbi:MAG: branched-chain amino acid ABC transporter permease [Halanaerobium sp.]|nr:branched-chain amino acid ABC transporter permease [Halanaerobium sp.]